MLAYTGKNDSRKLAADILIPTFAQMAEKDPDLLFLDADLMGCSTITSWARSHPDRAINCGIAEANMIGIACGLAAAGWKPFCHSFGAFASRRCFDQVFLSAGYAGNDITVIGTDPGIAAAYNGGTHMPFEDMALYRSIPHSTVIDVSDAVLLQKILPQLPARKGVKYLRMPRKEVPGIYTDETDFDLGRGKVLREGDDVTIVACGLMVAEALKAAEILESQGVHATVIDMFTVKPIDEKLLLYYAAKTGCIITAENHNRIGGLYSAVCEALAGAAKVYPVAVDDCFGEVGSVDYLRERFQLTAQHIVEVFPGTEYGKTLAAKHLI